jgi:ribosome-associated heat shock protein Hsp15
VRVDRFLFFIRLLKSRTQAQGLIDEGHVRIDGKRVEKSSEEVRVGSVIAFPLHDRVRVLRVLSMPTRRGPAPEARACYEELGPLREGQALTSRSPRHSEARKGSEFS